ncbi:hypothetical protein Bca52824_014902 [Brassica carinata]|uniref:Uncharacterized protein n=1 Tax=Brassica carinata TaxID=52824 RepID=A0A8X7W102_BRACI|nr:hypothetical protein Bca52824_014902 [Brassica carinata]
MARFQAVSKQSASVKSLKNKSQIAGADGSVAEIVTEVAIGSVLPCITEEDFASQEGSSSAAATNSSGPSSEIQLTLEDSTPTNAEEVGVVCLTPKCSNALPMEEPLGESPERQKESKSYASLLKASAELEEVGTPSEHVSGVPFVLIPDDNIAAAKEEFKELRNSSTCIDPPSFTGSMSRKLARVLRVGEAALGVALRGDITRRRVRGIKHGRTRKYSYEQEVGGGPPTGRD